MNDCVTSFNGWKPSLQMVVLHQGRLPDSGLSADQRDAALPAVRLDESLFEEFLLGITLE
jgi:hypothetical protein